MTIVVMGVASTYILLTGIVRANAVDVGVGSVCLLVGLLTII